MKWVLRVLSLLSRHYSSFPLLRAHEEIEKGNIWILDANDSDMTFFLMHGCSLLKGKLGCFLVQV